MHDQTTFSYTPRQQQIIDADVDNILVSAAAGAGKTAVLTDRIVSRLADGKADIRQLLVMTFTEAAASEMKKRIEKKLNTAVAAATQLQRQQLNRQLAWLNGASISTIHAFCLSVIRDFSHLLVDTNGQPLIDAAFSVDDGIEADLLLNQSLDQLLQQIYEWIDAVKIADSQSSDKLPPDNPVYALLAEQDQEDQEDQQDRHTAFIQAFYKLMDSFASGRTDEPVRELIVQQYQYLRSLPDYQHFVSARLADLKQAADHFDTSAYAAELLKMLELRLDRADSVLPQLTEKLDQTPPITFIKNKDRNTAYINQYRALITTINQMKQIFNADTIHWDALVDMGLAWQGLELPRANRADSDEKKEFMRLFNENVAELIHFVSGSCGTKKYQDYFVFDSKPVFILSAAHIQEDIKEMLPVVKVFYQLILGLDAFYLKQKQLLGLIDFADFEHLALRLLRMDEVKQYYQTRFSEIYVDEYQDTSSIQEAVIAAVSQRNCLMVGDLKQSIYKFRHARPQIFKEKADLFKRGSQGQLIELNRNFRSLATVLKPVNDLFEQLMSSGAGEIDYDEHQALVAHRQPEDSAQKSAHLLVLPLDEQKSGDNEEQENEREQENGVGLASDWPEDNDQVKQIEDLSIYEKEAALAAHEILQIKNKTAQSWQTFAILCRTRAMVQMAAAVLQKKNIPVLEGSDAQRFDIPELRLLEAFIHLADNAKQDIPLAAVMRSTLSGSAFSDIELAAMRLTADKENKLKFFYEAVSWYQNNGSDQSIRHKLNHFFNWLAGWREYAVYMRVDEWLRLLISQTHLLSMLSAQPEGPYKLRVLDQLITLAAGFEQHQRRGLHAFARYLESLREKDKLSTFFPQETQAADGVRIMTIHGSKGLEFPIVFLIGSQYQLTPKDSRQALLISENLGIGFDYANPQQAIRYPSHLKLAMLAEIKAGGMAEEMRLLYVALTRAQEHFYITAAVDFSKETRLERLRSFVRQAEQITSRNLPSHLVLACRNYLEWLMLSFARGSEADRFFNCVLDSAALDTEKSAWEIRRLSPVDLLDCYQQETTHDPVDLAILPSERFAGSNQNSDTEAQIKQLTRRIFDPYRYSRATHTPLKLAVSELKRYEQQPADEDQLSGEGYNWLNQLTASSPQLTASSPQLTASSPLQSGTVAPLNSGTPATLQMALGSPQTNTKPYAQPDESPPLPDLFDIRGINLTLQTTDLSQSVNEKGNKTGSGKKGGAAIGTLIHQVFRYLDLETIDRTEGKQALSRQLNQMYSHAVLSENDRAALAAWEDDIWAFVCSDLAEEMTAATKNESAIYREMPFTLAVPVKDIYTDGQGFAPDDRLLIQGMIDCWYEIDGQITLLDFKSDWIDGLPQIIGKQLNERYKLQMTWYARAIKASLGRPPDRCLIWHVRSRRAYSIQIVETHGSLL